MKKILAFIFSFLGFSLCACMKYGVPTAVFEVKGKVTDTEEQPLKDIRVVVARYDTVRTDSTGHYEHFMELGARNDVMPIEAVDVDGEANGGHFASTTVYVTLSKKDFKDEAGYEYELGKATKEVNFKLDRKGTEN